MLLALATASCTSCKVSPRAARAAGRTATRNSGTSPPVTRICATPGRRARRGRKVHREVAAEQAQHEHQREHGFAMVPDQARESHGLAAPAPLGPLPTSPGGEGAWLPSFQEPGARAAGGGEGFSERRLVSGFPPTW